MLETNCVSVRFSDDRWQRVRTASVFLTITTTEQKKKKGGGEWGSREWGVVVE